MAIKVTGTTVINDSRKIENVNGFNQVIRKPTITSPTDNATDTATDLTITGSAYAAVYSGTRDYREFQIDLSTGDFSSPIVSQQVNDDSLTLSVDLAFSTEHKIRIRDVDLDGTTSDFSDVVTFTTEVDPFTVAGSSVSGGFYMGTIAAFAGACYYLIVAPNSTGCACCLWKTTSSATAGTGSATDGYANTIPAMENSLHPAGNFTATRTIGGFSDWYFPAIDELEVIYNNGGGNGPGDPLPAGEKFDVLGSAYNSSTEENCCLHCLFDFSDGTPGSTFKASNKFPVRAVRREPI